MKIVVGLGVITKIGGLERVGLSLVNAMCSRGHECSIITPDLSEKEYAFPVNESVKIIRMEWLDTSYRRYCWRRKIVAEKPDVFIALCAGEDAIKWAVILKETNIPFIISEHSDPYIIETERWTSVEKRHAVLAAADSIHSLSDLFVPFYPKFLRSRMFVIANPVDVPKESSDTVGKCHSIKRIINVGHIKNSTKQQQVLAKAFSLIATDFPEWRLEFWGEGVPLEVQALQSVVESCRAKSQIFICGETKNIKSKFLSAQVFAFPSRFEGCPNALLEALAFGLPALGYAGCRATSGIIEDGVNGVLFNELTPESIAVKLRLLLENAGLRKELGETAKITAQKYQPNVIYDGYEEMFELTISEKADQKDGVSAGHGHGQEDKCLNLFREICSREYVEKNKSPNAYPLPVAVLSDARKRLSKRYIRPIRDFLREKKSRKTDWMRDVGKLK